MSQDKLWLLKHKNGRIQGPLSADEIIELIADKTVDGEETIAVYPGGRWKPISVEPQFYESLLTILSYTDVTGEDTSHTNPVTAPESYFKSDQSASLGTVVADMSELKALRKKRRKKRKHSSARLKRKKQPAAARTVIYQLEEEEYQDKTTELSNGEATEDKRKLISSWKNKKRIFFVLTLTVVFAALFFPAKKDQQKIQEYIELKKPRKKIASLPAEQQEALIKKGLIQYLHSTVSSYVKSQTLLVQAVEGGNKNTYAMAMLCLVYLELWPFTKQDLKSTNIISSLIHKTSVLNKGGVRSGLCHSVGLIIKGKYDDAKTMVESSLDGLNRAVKDIESQNMTPLFYYLKIRILYYLNDYTTMMSYLDTIQKMLPKWVAPYMLTADTLLKQNKIAGAITFYKKVIELNPKHKAAKIKVGLIEYKHFNKVEKAENILKIALGYPEIVSNQILSDAYFSLAEINVKKGSSEVALKYARLAYSYNPANKASRNLVIQIGGVEKLKQTRVRSNQLVYEADQLVLNNNFQAAIGYYEEAFKVDGEQNARVAIKIAQNYWVLSFSDQAIEWLKKAINANPTMMEAYVLMAEYYSEQYDFYNAEKVLQIASRKVPRSYELYRGRAYLAFKKGNYPKVIRYAKTALDIYEADIESYVILSESYAKLGDMNESLASATRGLEVDPNAIKTQVAYAKALGGVYGVDTGVDYFRKLVENYPLVIEYQMEWMKYLFEDEQYHKAKEVVFKIIDIEPKYNTAYFYLGRILMFSGDFKGAYESFLQAAILNPSDPLPTFYVGMLRLKEKRYSMAKEQFKKVLALNKLYPKAYYYLGRIAFLQGNYERAIKEARLESRSNPNFILPYLLAGESYEKLKQFLNCAVEYQKAVELAPENMSFYVKIARCYRHSGHLDLAVKILKKASGEDSTDKPGDSQLSGDPQLYKELAVIYEIRGKYPEALESYCHYLNLIPRAPDRQEIEGRMKKLSKLTGKEIKNCG